MTDIPSLSTLFDRFAAIVAAVVASLVVRVRERTVRAEVGEAAQRRIRGVCHLVSVLFRRLQDGTLRDWVRRAAARREARVARAVRAVRVPGSVSVPRRVGWLCPLMPCTERYRDSGGLHAGRLAALLAEPEMRRLLADHPRLGLAMRPLCRMLGVDEALYLDVTAPVAAAAEPVPDVVPEAPPEPPVVAVGGVVPWYHQKWANGRW